MSFRWSPEQIDDFVYLFDFDVRFEEAAPYMVGWLVGWLCRFFFF